MYESSKITVPIVLLNNGTYSLCWLQLFALRRGKGGGTILYSIKLAISLNKNANSMEIPSFPMCLKKKVCYKKKKKKNNNHLFMLFVVLPIFSFHNSGVLLSEWKCFVSGITS